MIDYKNVYNFENKYECQFDTKNQCLDYINVIENSINSMVCHTYQYWTHYFPEHCSLICIQHERVCFSSNAKDVNYQT